jgi:hypothetical protein
MNKASIDVSNESNEFSEKSAFTRRFEKIGTRLVWRTRRKAIVESKARMKL